MNSSANVIKIMGVAMMLGVLGNTAFAANLVINGKVASTNVRTVDGVAYVKVADVASALGMAVVKIPGGYEITRAGGAGQINGLEGKIGDQLFDGKWRFKVTGVDKVSSYAMKTSGDPYDYPSGVDYNSVTRILTVKPGNTLYVIHCTVVNGQKTKQTLWTAPHDSNTALTDDNGQSYPPIAQDFDGSPIQTKPLLPGSKIEFPVLFCVPDGTVLKDLVFTLHNNNSATKGDEVRVSLKS